MTDATASGWRRLRVGGVSLDVPEGLVPASGQAIEGPVVVLEGAGLRVTLDGSPFADPLTGLADESGHERWSTTVGGRPTDIVSFRDRDGTTVLATRLETPVTAVVRVAPGGDTDVALRILRSIVPGQGEPDG